MEHLSLGWASLDLISRLPVPWLNVLARNQAATAGLCVGAQICKYGDLCQVTYDNFIK